MTRDGFGAMFQRTNQVLANLGSLLGSPHGNSMLCDGATQNAAFRFVFLQSLLQELASQGAVSLVHCAARGRTRGLAPLSSTVFPSAEPGPAGTACSSFGGEAMWILAMSSRSMKIGLGSRVGTSLRSRCQRG